MNAEQIEIMTGELIEINRLIEECNITEGRVYDVLIKEKKRLSKNLILIMFILEIILI